MPKARSKPVPRIKPAPFVIRWIWKCIGLLFVALAGLGAVLPLLPTTPFIILAAACFAKSSPRLHRWLMHSRLFGPMLHDWEQNRCVRRPVKIFALSVIVLVGIPPLLFAPVPGWAKFLSTSLLGIGFCVVCSLRVCTTANCTTTDDAATETPTAKTYSLSDPEL